MFCWHLQSSIRLKTYLAKLKVLEVRAGPLGKASNLSDDARLLKETISNTGVCCARGIWVRIARPREPRLVQNHMPKQGHITVKIKPQARVEPNKIRMPGAELQRKTTAPEGVAQGGLAQVETSCFKKALKR